jgi:hypothetical protein
VTGRVRRRAAHCALGRKDDGLVGAYRPHTTPALIRAKARLALWARIHSQQGIGEAAWELVYFGRDPNARPRLYFDPDTGRVEEHAAV